MKKKIVSLCLVIALLATAITGATLAYFTDTDADINVMTTGKAKIVQNEQQREMELIPVYSKYDAEGEPTTDAIVVGYDTKYKEADNNNKVKLEAFDNDKLMVPAVYYDEEGNVSEKSVDNWGKVSYDEAFTGKDTGELLDKSIKNEVDKIVTVTNRGNVPVYVRTVFLFEDALITAEDAAKEACKNDTCGCPDGGHYLSNQVAMWWTENKSDDRDTGYYNWIEDAGELKLIDINGTKYCATVHYYDVELMPGQTTVPSLKQMALNPVTTNDSFNKYLGEDGKYTVIAFSQAVQADGFDDDHEALDAAFGEVTATSICNWITNKDVDINIDTIGEGNNVGGGEQATPANLRDSLIPTEAAQG